MYDMEKATWMFRCKRSMQLRIVSNKDQKLLVGPSPKETERWHGETHVPKEKIQILEFQIDQTEELSQKENNGVELDSPKEDK